MSRIMNAVGQGLIEGATFIARPVTFEVINGRAIFEGDIVLGTVAEVEAQTRRLTSLRPVGVELAVVLSGNRFRWLDCQIPFDFDPALPEDTQDSVKAAMEHWQEETPIRFVTRTSENAHSHPDWVRFQPGDVCRSAVGRRGIGMQAITLSAGCGFGQVVHEIGHTVGLWHEQSRQDRDQFVEILWDNILPDKLSNFNQQITDGDDVGPYDYHSIMHYGRTDFTRNGQDTIRLRMERVEIGQRDGLSWGDIAAVQSMYRGQVGLAGNDRWATTFSLDRTERMYFFLQHERELVVHYWDGVDEWLWARQGTPGEANAVTSAPDVLTSWQFYRWEERQLHAFVRAADGSLYEHGWSDSGVHPLGTGWYWRRMGEPLGKDLRGTTPGAISFRSESISGEYHAVFDRIELFIPDRSGGIHRCSWNAFRERWDWYDQQAPGYVDSSRRPRAVAFWFDGHKRIYSFIPSLAGNLWVNFASDSLPRTPWQWADLGAPRNGVKITSSVTAVTYRHDSTDRIYTFVTGNDGHLHTCFWSGALWEWADLGAPANGITAEGTPAAIVFAYLDRNQLHTFVRGSDGDLYHHFWNGENWIWESLARPTSSVSITGDPAVLPYTHRHIDRLYVFCRGSDGNFYICYNNDRGEWAWTNQGAP